MLPFRIGFQLKHGIDLALGRRFLHHGRTAFPPKRYVSAKERVIMYIIFMACMFSVPTIVLLNLDHLRVPKENELSEETLAALEKYKFY